MVSLVMLHFDKRKVIVRFTCTGETAELCPLDPLLDTLLAHMSKSDQGMITKYRYAVAGVWERLMEHSTCDDMF